MACRSFRFAPEHNHSAHRKPGKRNLASATCRCVCAIRLRALSCRVNRNAFAMALPFHCCRYEMNAKNTRTLAADTVAIASETGGSCRNCGRRKRGMRRSRKRVEETTTPTPRSRRLAALIRLEVAELDRASLSLPNAWRSAAGGAMLFAWVSSRPSVWVNHSRRASVAPGERRRRRTSGQTTSATGVHRSSRRASLCSADSSS
jgi:ssDNA-binding Zn-finger/Zn-ribbon topoisomerase 1